MTRYPLMQPKSGHKDLCYTPNNNTRYLVHELGSSEMSDVINRLLRLISRGEYITKTQRKQVHTYLIIPTFLLHSFQHEARNSLQLQMVTSAGPHIRVEAMDKYKHVYWDGDGR